MDSPGYPSGREFPMEDSPILGIKLYSPKDIGSIVQDY